MNIPQTISPADADETDTTDETYIVTVVTDPGTRETRVQDISQPALVRALAGAATWERFDTRAADWVRIDPPARHAAVLFDSTSYHHLPVLSGLTRQLYLRPDGSLMLAAWFDVATGMFGVFDAREFVVPECPTRAQDCAKRWITAGREVAIAEPDPGQDWNDEAAA